jgi:hypothetical protein
VVGCFESADMLTLTLVLALVQASAMAFDEGWFHRRRGLPRWERIGHPLDTLSAALCFAWMLWADPKSPHAIGIYVGLGIFSSILITKDEFIHAKHCAPTEHWLHAVLFVVHPMVLTSFGYLWISQVAAVQWMLQVQLGLILLFAVYQIFYWSIFCNHRNRPIAVCP